MCHTPVTIPYLNVCRTLMYFIPRWLHVILQQQRARVRLCALGPLNYCAFTHSPFALPRVFVAFVDCFVLVPCRLFPHLVSCDWLFLTTLLILKASFQELNRRLLISNDSYVRTTSDFHKKTSQRLWTICAEKGDIYLGKYEVTTRS